MSVVWTELRGGIAAGSEAAWNAVNVETYRVAITGLSRAGKTVLLVSLISNLLAMGRGLRHEQRHSLPKLAAHLMDQKGHSRLLGAEIEASGTQRIPRFDYEGLRDQLAAGAAPAWPPVTDRPALITLRLKLAPRSWLGRLKRGALQDAREVRLELLDYPGEWLADLPLLSQSYERWSASALAELNAPQRAGFATPFLEFLASLQATAPLSDQVASHGFRLYRDVLRRCREEAGLRWLQPGRFLMPGPWGETPLLHFFPWSGAASPRRGSLGAQLQARFDAYRNEVRTTFFEPYFSRFNRQIVLVDLPGALAAGRAAFEDVQLSLQKIGDSYTALLEGGWFNRRKIEAVAFAATKSDHVDDHRRDQLRLLVERMVNTDKPAAKDRVQRSFHAVAAMRCTRDDDLMVEGKIERVVWGVPLGKERQQVFRPGSLPPLDLPDSYWGDRPYFELPQLRPPIVLPGDDQPIPNLNLDELLVALLGDVL